MSIRFEKIWVQQCTATKGIKRRFGVKSALDYLIREKLLNFADAAERHPEFARELPRFLAEVWRIFNQYEIAGYVGSLKPKQRKRLRSLLYLRLPTRGPATARVGSGDGLTALGVLTQHQRLDGQPVDQGSYRVVGCCGGHGAEPLQRVGHG